MLAPTKPTPHAMNRHLHPGHAHTASRGALAVVGAGIVGGVVGGAIANFIAPLPVDPARGAGSAKRLFEQSNAGH